VCTFTRRCYALIVAAQLSSGCAISLEPTPEKQAAAEEPLSEFEVQRCAAFDELSPQGRIDTTRISGERLLVTFSSALFEGERTTLAGILPDAEDPCASEFIGLARPAIAGDGSAQDEDTHGPLASFSWDDGSEIHTYAFYESAQGFGESEGIGIARFDEVSERLTPVALLWTGDCPRLGSAALVEDGYVYVLGGAAARFLDADVYLARAPLAEVEQASAYEYWHGSGRFTSDVDLAVPIVRGGVAPSVAWYVAQERYLMLYATPLANELTVRVGLGITGPWSMPYTLVTCPAPSAVPDAFCAEAILQPPFGDSRQLSLSVARGAFDAPDDAAWETLTTLWGQLDWPDELP